MALTGTISQPIGENEESQPLLVTDKQVSLCADYRSGSDSDSCDSESDSSSSEDSNTSDSSDSEDSDDDDNNGYDNKAKNQKANKKKTVLTDLSLADLPPIEDLKISVPEDKCLEIGVVSSIVDTLVVVESYKGTEALDVGSVLFLDKGKQSLGKVFDVLGPVTEPVYTVRFTTSDQIVEKKISQGMKVFCAPKTEYSSFVFLADLMKFKGSDASWKDNIEVPPECQDFSDDEEERRFKSPNKNVRNENNRRNVNDNNSGNIDNVKKSKKWNNEGNYRSGRFIRPSRFQGPITSHHPGSTHPGNSRPFLPRSSPSQSFTPLSSPINPYARPPLPFAVSHPYYPSQSQGYEYHFNIPPFPGNMAYAPIPPPPPPAPGISNVQPLGYNTTPTNFNVMPNRMAVPPFPFSQGPQHYLQQPIQQPQMHFGSPRPRAWRPQMSQNMPTDKQAPGGKPSV